MCIFLCILKRQCQCQNDRLCPAVSSIFVLRLRLRKLQNLLCQCTACVVQAMNLMLPPSGDCPESQGKSSLEGKLDCMSLNGYGSTARENVDLNR